MRDNVAVYMYLTEQHGIVDFGKDSLDLPRPHSDKYLEEHTSY